MAGKRILEAKEIRSNEELSAAKKIGLTLVDFGAPWCAPCRLQDPIIRKLAHRFAGKACIATVNIDQIREMAWNLGIQSIPTLIFYKNGQEVQRLVGLQSEGTLSEALLKLLK